jgi:hypothetical protein
MIEQVLIENEMAYDRLSKKEGIAISKTWIETFLSNVKEQTGKYLVGRFKWEAYWGGIEPALSGHAAIQNYISRSQEDFYILDESGRNVFLCSACKWPNFIEAHQDMYIVPKSFAWTMVYSHEGTCHYANSKT